MRRTVRLQPPMAMLLIILSLTPLLSQDKPARLLLKVEQTSSGPFAGEKSTLCLLVYSDGRMLDSERSSAVTQQRGTDGKGTRPEKTVTFEYQIAQPDLLRKNR